MKHYQTKDDQWVLMDYLQFDPTPDVEMEDKKDDDSVVAPPWFEGFEARIYNVLRIFNNIISSILWV